MNLLKPDVVVIGSGAGGGAITWALCNAGLKVLVIEAGPHYQPENDYKLHLPDWEDGFPHKLVDKSPPAYAQMQRLDPKYEHLRSWNHIKGRLNPSNHRVSFGYQRVLGVGGSSLHFSGEAHRLNPASMRMKSRFGVAADWPLSYNELEPFYLQAEKVVGVAGPAKDPRCPRSAGYPQRPHKLSFATEKLKVGFNKLGLTLNENSLAILSQPFEGRPGCNYCGGCLKGCPRRDKGSIDVTYIKKALATKKCHILAGASATRIETGEGDRVKGVHYEQNGKQHFVATPKLIIAAGAIETPRLLLTSENNQSPDGLCNESGEVGKNFMETLLWSSNGFYPEKIGSHRGLSVDAICWDFNKPDAIPDVIGGCRFSPSVAESDLLGPKSYASRVVPGWGLDHKQAMRQRFGSALSISGIAESLPHPKTSVALSQEKDASGNPKALISSYIDDMAVSRIAFMANKCREILDACGVNEIFEEFSSYDIFSSTHVFGTCRMGTDSDTSVVNEWCKSHRWENLFIVDASIFPSSGGGESPGLTIQALALRAAKKIISDI